MGYETPSIDRIAREGIKFLHYYGEQSCTAGRAAFLTGQHGIRTGLTKVGFPGAPMGMSQLDPSIGGLLKNLGYATGQFGKNHVGDRNESLPTVNGFDEFFGNLYHLNAEEEPELPDYPKDPAYLAKFGPRGVLEMQGDRPRRSDGRSALRQDRQADHRGYRRADQEAHGDDRRRDLGCGDRLHEAAASGRQAVLLLVQRRPACICAPMSAPDHRGRYTHGDSEYIDGMLEHDDTVGSLLKSLDDMGIANDTIVVYSSDNGPHMNTWPDGAMTWFRSEKNTNWEGAFRVPCLVRWPGVIKPGTVTNELMSHNDWIPTLLRHRRRARYRQQAKAGYTANGINYKVHLDGYDQSAVPAQCQRHRGQQQRHEKRARQVLLLRRRRSARGAPARATTSTSSPNSAWQERWAYGPSPSRSFACRRSSTCSRIRSSGPTSRPTLSGTGRSTMSGRSTARWTTSSSSWDIQGISAALVPAEFQPGKHHGITLDTMKQKKALTEGLDLERIRGNLNRMIEQQLQQRGQDSG